MIIKLIFLRYKAIKNIPMLINLVLKLSIFLKNHILRNLVLKLSNNYIRSNIAIKQVNMRFILILERYKIKHFRGREIWTSNYLIFTNITIYHTIGKSGPEIKNFRPYHNISHYCESDYYIHSYLIHRILEFLQLLLVSSSMYTRICGILM